MEKLLRAVSLVIIFIASFAAPSQVTAQDGWCTSTIRDDIAAHMLETVPPGPEDLDFNSDGIIDTTDYSICVANWAEQPTSSPSLSASPTSIDRGQSVTASWGGLNPTGNDWISLHPAGAPDSNYLSWQHASGSSGSVSFTAPSDAGRYEFRLFRNGARVAASNTFEVSTGQITPSLPTQPSEPTSPEQPSESNESPCPGGVGPGGIVAGDYPPTSLTQDQRQWLWDQFGHTGIAPVGFGGERCTPTQTQSWWYGNPGALNLGGYCQARGYLDAVLVGNDAYGWRCRDASGGLSGIDLFDSCRWQYGSGTPVFGNFSDPASWRCEGIDGGAASQPGSASSEPPPPVAPSGPSEPRLSATTGLRVRSGPGVNHQHIATIYPGQTYRITGKNGNSLWLQIDYNGRAGWVCRQYTTANGADVFTLPVTDRSTADCSGGTTSPPSSTALPQKCSEPVEAQYNYAVGGLTGQVLRVPSFQPRTGIEVYFEGRRVPNAANGVDTDHPLREENGFVYYGISVRWIYSSGENGNWNVDDHLWEFLHDCQ